MRLDPWGGSTAASRTCGRGTGRARPSARGHPSYPACGARPRPRDFPLRWSAALTLRSTAHDGGEELDLLGLLLHVENDGVETLRELEQKVRAVRREDQGFVHVLLPSIAASTAQPNTKKRPQGEQR